MRLLFCSDPLDPRSTNPVYALVLPRLDAQERSVRKSVIVKDYVKNEFVFSHRKTIFLLV